MRLKTIAAFAIAVAAMGTVSASPVMARPHQDNHRPHNDHRARNHHRPHKVCRMEWRHHHKVRVCNWR